MSVIRWGVVKNRKAGTWEGYLELPDRLGQSVKVSATANTKQKALARSASVAEKALDNPAIQALLPPGAGPALKQAAKMLRSDTAKKIGRGAKSLFRKVF